MKPFHALRSALAVALVAATLAGCDGETWIGDGSGHSLVLHDDVLTARADGHPDATIDAAGKLAIGGKAVALTPAQRAALQGYRSAAIAVRAAGIETGKAGATMAVHAVGDAVTGALHGDGDQASARIERRAEDVRRKALAICDRLDALQQAQDRLATTVPSFKPYATLEVRADDDCRRDAMHQR